ncbi:zinc-binding dehydrogenase [Amycolatopsis suaedae]|uniref:Alcohol dehydrogenase n=1 Tax=Amycolatopsis suaedae TaxID=2510978 RepID=A0A4Q7J5E2_9PSEU|nr:zinc-binding dehydrogenase [Amycolatopsis suaedae]RZQ61523.1 alcohol dehydrogenase [Amycolatopsis suaedae]
MRVIAASAFGGPEVLGVREAPDPVAGPGTVVLDVSHAEVLFLDTQLRAGWGGEYFRLEPPFVLGAGVAGTVRSLGDGVDASWAGRRVVAHLGFSGGYAERVEAAVADLVPVPEGVAAEAALAALHDGATALGELEGAAPRPGERVLVTAAGGSLGSWLIPLARAAGAEVIAAARGERKLAAARELGAHAVVDYSRPEWTDGLSADVVFDGIGGAIGRAAFDVTARGGRFRAYGAASGDFAGVEADEARARGVALSGIVSSPSGEERSRLMKLAMERIASGAVRPRVGATFPLERARDAHAAIEARTVVGKTVLTV